MKRNFILLPILTLFLILINTNTTQISAEETQPSLISLTDLNLDSDNYILIDLNSGQILDSKNKDVSVYPASITKALTLITAIEMLEGTDLENTYYTLPHEIFDDLDPEASLADLVQGETYSLNDILYSINLPSGADATRAISMYLTQDPEGLSKNMNELTKRLGLTNSNFENTSGLDNDKHLTTVNDLARIIEYALKNETFTKIYTTPRYQYQNQDGTPYILKNHALLYAVDEGFEFMSGAKSGYTDLSERSLSSMATKGDMNLLFVSTNATYDYDINYSVLDAIAVYNYVFNNYKYHKVEASEDIITTIPIVQGAYDVDIVSDQSFEVLLPINAVEENITYEFVPAQEEFIAPVESNTLIGTLKVYYENQLISSREIETTETIEIHWLYIFFHYFIEIGKWVIGIMVLLLLLLIGYRANYRRKRKISRTMASRR